LEENIKEDKSSKKIDHGQLSKKKKTPTDYLEHLTEKKKEQVG
jgi:hypothetical protein